MATKKQQHISQDQHESAIVEMMVVAQGIAETYFGSSWNAYAVNEIADYLEIVGDPAEFTPDLKRIYAHAQKVYKTTSPTPEQVFGLFDRIYDDEE